MWSTITFVNAQMSTPRNGSSPGATSTATVNKPTGLKVGDLILAVTNANKAGLTAPPIGDPTVNTPWNFVDNQDASVNAYRNGLYWKIADASDVAATNFVWTNGDAASPMYACLFAYRGVDPGEPIHAAAATVATTTEPQTTPTVTTTIPTMLFRCRTVRISDSNTAGTTTFSGSGSERGDTGNYATVGYWIGAYDPNAMTAAGSQTGISISHTNGTLTDGITRSIALAPYRLDARRHDEAVRRSSLY